MHQVNSGKSVNLSKLSGVCRLLLYFHQRNLATFSFLVEKQLARMLSMSTTIVIIFAENNISDEHRFFIITGRWCRHLFKLQLEFLAFPEASYKEHQTNLCSIIPYGNNNMLRDTVHSLSFFIVLVKRLVDLLIRVWNWSLIIVSYFCNTSRFFVSPVCNDFNLLIDSSQLLR